MSRSATRSMPAFRNLASAALVFLAACSPQTPGDEDASSPDVAAVAGTDGSNTEPIAAPTSTPESAAPDAALPPPDAERRYVGRWAADAGMCRDAAWVFTRDRLETAGSVVCDFTEVTDAPGGYDIAARCFAEAPPQADSFRLRFAESAGAMLIEGSSVLADAGLVYCGPG